MRRAIITVIMLLRCFTVGVETGPAVATCMFVAVPMLIDSCVIMQQMRPRSRGPKDEPSEV